MICKVRYSTGVHDEDFLFEDPCRRKLWSKKITQIKKESARIRTIKDNEGPTPRVIKMYEDWVKFVLDDFLKEFTEDCLPLDIKWSLNVTQERMGQPVTKWLKVPLKTVDHKVFEIAEDSALMFWSKKNK